MDNFKQRKNTMDNYNQTAADSKKNPVVSQ